MLSEKVWKHGLWKTLKTYYSDIDKYRKICFEISLLSICKVKQIILYDGNLIETINIENVLSSSLFWERLNVY